MANYSIAKRSGKYCCQLRWIPTGTNKRKSCSRTFTRKATAEAWGKKKLNDLEAGLSAGEVFESVLLGELLDKYLDDRHVNIGRSKRYSLAMIRDSDIASIETKNLTPKHIVDYCKDRSDAGASAATVSCDVSNLRSVLKCAEALYDIPVTVEPIVKAMPTLHTLGLVGKAKIRTRRPTNDEITRLRTGLLARQNGRGAIIPFVDLLDFSILSCMRISEVCNLKWDDLNINESWVWVRDRKDPRKKVGNHMKVPLLGGSLDIVLRQKKTYDPRIFPYNNTSVSAGFQRVRDQLDIEDLRYHDLRREGASRLFEAGYKIDEVAQVTGHRDLNTLWRIYTDLNPTRITDR
ncbi:MAG: site-specific integrase [Gammaproteobacteria bacterium]|nr:site-specific integrase [Gammaproteobacteria bacterium]